MKVKLEKRNSPYSRRRLIKVNDIIITGKELNMFLGAMRSLRESSELTFWQLDRDHFVLENGKYEVRLFTKLTRDMEYIPIFLTRYLLFPNSSFVEFGTENDFLTYSALMLLSLSEKIVIEKKGEWTITIGRTPATEEAVSCEVV